MLAYKAFKGMKDLPCIRILIRGHYYDIQTKNLASFCWCPENWGEAKSKGSGLCCVAEKISKQHGVRAVHGTLSLLSVRFTRRK